MKSTKARRFSSARTTRPLAKATSAPSRACRPTATSAWPASFPRNSKRRRSPSPPSPPFIWERGESDALQTQYILWGGEGGDAYLASPRAFPYPPERKDGPPPQKKAEGHVQPESI